MSINNNNADWATQGCEDLGPPIMHQVLNEAGGATQVASAYEDLGAPSSSVVKRESDRVFDCEHCFKLFKLKRHLKSHSTACKGKKIDWFQCEICSKQLKSKRTLTKHKKTCKNKGGYSCIPECGKVFNTFTDLNIHRKAFHQEVDLSYCCYCDFRGSKENSKRHEKHHEVEGFYASSAKKLESESVYKITEFVCDICHKMLKSKKVLNEHMKRHGQNRNSKEKVIFVKKQVTWKSEIETIKVIENSKFPLNGENINILKEMSKHLDNVMGFMTNRKELIFLENLKKQYENVSRRNFEIEVFQALLDVNPTLYVVDIIDNQLVVTFDNIKIPITPSKKDKRMQDLRESLDNLVNEQKKYLDLMTLPLIRYNNYKTAKEILNENRSIISSEEEQEFDNLEDKVRHNLAKKEKYNKKRENMEKVWGSLRLPKLIILIKSIFQTEKKKSLTIIFLETKIKSISKSEHVKEDIKYLINEKNGWINIFGKYYVLDTSMDIDEVCM